MQNLYEERSQRKMQSVWEECVSLLKEVSPLLLSCAPCCFPQLWVTLLAQSFRLLGADVLTLMCMTASIHVCCGTAVRGVCSAKSKTSCICKQVIKPSRDSKHVAHPLQPRLQILAFAECRPSFIAKCSNVCCQKTRKCLSALRSLYNSASKRLHGILTRLEMWLARLCKLLAVR